MIEEGYCKKLMITIATNEYNKNSYKEVASRLLKNPKNIGVAKEFTDLYNETEENLNKLRELHENVCR